MKCVSLSQEMEGPAVLQFGKVIYLLASYYVFYNRSELTIKTVPLDSKICVSMTTVNAAAGFRDQHCNTELCISLVSSTLRNHLNGWTEQAHRNLNRDTWGKEEDLFSWLQYKKWQFCFNSIVLWLSLLHIEIDLILNIRNASMKAQPT